MRTDDEKNDIKVQSYVWKSALMYLTGHYEFEIVVKTTKGKYTSQKTFYRRYSDLEILHEGLIRFNPGCRIASLPEKSIWCNFYVNNDYSLEKRKRNIEEYLNYINIHKYLSSNPIFFIFLSDDFERYKTEFNKKSTLIDKLYSLKQYFPILFKFNCLDGTFLAKERDNLMRLDKGISEIQSIVENFIKLNEDTSESLKNILSVTKSLEHTNLKIEEPQIDDNYKKIKKGMENNIEVFFNLYDKNKGYCQSLGRNVMESLKKYLVEVVGLKEIYERKDKITDNLNKIRLLNDDFVPNKSIDISELEELIIQTDLHLSEEITSFKNYREKDLIDIMRRFFIERHNYDVEVASIFDFNIDSMKMEISEEYKEIDNKENHFG